MGPYWAIALAILLIMALAIIYRASSASRTADNLVQEKLDEFVSDIENEKKITYAEYLDLKDYLFRSGGGYDIELSIMRQNELLSSVGRSLLPVTADDSKIMRTAASNHVHTQSCYVGHNHSVNGCTYHSHDSSCYCSSTVNYSYSVTLTCSKCAGSGSVSSQAGCSSCGGRGYTEKTVSECSNGAGRTWNVCSYCGGSGCKHCDEGENGGWYTCNGCGLLTGNCTCAACQAHTVRTNCARCGATGYVTATVTCPQCNGSGNFGKIDYYTCPGCGGSTTSPGRCERLICSIYNGWSCQQSVNDTTPICDRVVISAEPRLKEQSIYLGDGSTFDPYINVTYLNGDTGEIKCSVSGLNEHTYATHTATLSHTGYFGNAQTYGTQTFGVSVSVVPKSKTCPYCGNEYDLNQNGTDPGCPICQYEYISISVNPAYIYLEPGATDISAAVTVTYKNRKQRVLQRSEWSCDCNYSNLGEQFVKVSATDIFGNTVYEVVTVMIMKHYTCNVCGREYECDSNGTNPGCPYCGDRLLEIRAVLSRTEYGLSEELDASLYAVYRDRTELLPQSAWYDNFNPDMAGRQTITFFYGGLTCSCEVNITNGYLRTCPYCGEEYDSSLFDDCPSCSAEIVAITARYNEDGTRLGNMPDISVYAVTKNGASNPVTKGVLIGGYDKNKTGDQTVMITYAGFSTQVLVNVYSADVTEDSDLTITGGTLKDVTVSSDLDGVLGEGRYHVIEENGKVIIVLDADIYPDITINVQGDVCIDLNGHGIYGRQNNISGAVMPVNVISGTLELTRSGKVKGSDSQNGIGAAGITVSRAGSLVIGGQVTVLGGKGLTGGGGITANTTGTITVNGTVSAGAGAEGTENDNGGDGGTGINVASASECIINGNVFGGNGGNCYEGTPGRGGKGLRGDAVINGSVTDGTDGICTAFSVSREPTSSPLGEKYLICWAGHTYEKNADGSDPGCPYCRYWDGVSAGIYTAASDRSRGVSDYSVAAYSSEILDSLENVYQQAVSEGLSTTEALNKACYELKDGDIVTITITCTDKNLAQRALSFFGKGTQKKFTAGCTITF